MKNLEIIKQNEMSANISSNMQTTYVLTAKGKKDMEDQKQDLMMAHEKQPLQVESWRNEWRWRRLLNYNKFLIIFQI